MADSDEENYACDTRGNAQADCAKRTERLNDSFRRSFVGGRVVMTSGINALGPAALDAIVLAVQQHEQFDAENDPHNEHDFGSFTWGRHRLCWKIDYYDKQLQFGSPDPSNANLTTRVLTIMLAAEY